MCVCVFSDPPGVRGEGCTGGSCGSGACVSEEVGSLPAVTSRDVSSDREGNEEAAMFRSVFSVYCETDVSCVKLNALHHSLTNLIGL